MTAEQIWHARDLADQAEKHRLAAMVLGGLRRCEVLGLG